MNLANMRLKFKAYHGGLADDESDAEIDVRLNEAFRYTLPAQVPGFLQEGTEEFYMNPVDDGSKVVDSLIVAPRDGALVELREHWITGYPGDVSRSIRVHTNYRSFWSKFEYADAATASGVWPTDVLFHGGKWTWRPRGFSVFYFTCPVSRYPTETLATTAGTDELDGISDYNHAMCVSLLASLEFAEEKSRMQFAPEIQSALKRHMSGLRKKSVSGAKQRRAVRTF